MNAQRSHSPATAPAAQPSISEAIDGSMRAAMEFIESNPGPANGPQQTAQAHKLSRKARQLARLIGIIGEEFAGSFDSYHDVEIVGLAADLSDSLYQEIANASDTPPAGVYPKSGQLMAAVFFMDAAAQQIARVTDVDARRALADRFGWLQDAANDMAIEIVDLLCARQTAEADQL